jgi:hypothetical protein
LIVSDPTPDPDPTFKEVSAPTPTPDPQHCLSLIAFSKIPALVRDTQVFSIFSPYSLNHILSALYSLLIIFDNFVSYQLVSEPEFVKV